MIRVSLLSIFVLHVEDWQIDFSNQKILSTLQDAAIRAFDLSNTGKSTRIMSLVMLLISVKNQHSTEWS